MPLTRPRFEQLNTIITNFTDPISVLNKGSTQANIDVGFIFNRDGGINSNVAVFWDESANTFVTAFTTDSGINNANISIAEYANLRINTLTADTAAFSSTGAIKIPSGNTLQRTSGTTGEIRFNTTTSQFEGYQGTSWSSLGGVRSVDNATYIIAESYPGAGNNALYFYTDNTLRANLSSTGLNLSGNVLATTGTFSGMTINGATIVGNGSGIRLRTVESSGVIYIQAGNGVNNSANTITFAPWFSTTPTLSIDIANRRVGIKKSNPQTELDITGNITANYFSGSGSTLTDINSFGNIFVSGQSPVLADNTSDTLTLVAGSGITITTDAANDSVTFTTVSTLGAFGTDNEFGLVTDVVTVSEDLGDLASTNSTTYDLGTLVAASGLIYPDQLVLPSYTVATLPSAGVAAQIVYVSNETGGAVLAFSDGTNWRRVTDRAIVS